MKKAKKTIWDNVIIMNSALLGVMVLINVFVVFLPKLKIKNNPLLHYNYEVECCSYVVTGENKERVGKNNFFFNDKNVENSSAQTSLNVELNDASHVIIEYSFVNRAEDVPLEAEVLFNNLTIENCNLEYSFSDEFSQVDSESLDFRIAPNSKSVCRIKISIDNYALDALCEGKLMVVLSIAKGE